MQQEFQNDYKHPNQQSSVSSSFQCTDNQELKVHPEPSKTNHFPITAKGIKTFLREDQIIEEEKDSPKPCGDKEDENFKDSLYV